MQPVFRFAPSPNGYLHLGHAYSALLNQQLAHQAGGRFLLRIEDIDTVRCRTELVDAVFEDLHWLGLSWEEPVLRQSEHFARYRAALDHLDGEGLIYPCFCSRGDIAKAVARHENAGCVWPRDPDGAPVYTGNCRQMPANERAQRSARGEPYVLRLNMKGALERYAGDLSWSEFGEGRVLVDPALWGDVVLARRDVPTSYHLSVVADDGLQGVTDIVRGRDLFHATAIHRLLQIALGLPQPRYRHHALLLDEEGKKLAKSRVSTPIRTLRTAGVDAAEVRWNLGFRA